MTVRIQYLGATLDAPDFLEHIWPYEMPLGLWPTFCGAGDGLGDKIVPDVIYGVRVSPVCLIHDLDWAVSQNTYAAFQAANNRMLRNLVAFVGAHLTGKEYAKALARSILYYIAVSSWIGWRNFEPAGEDPWVNPIVRDRLNRLARAKFRLDEARN